MKLAAANHRTEEEIAIGNVVHAVAQDAALDRALIHSGVDGGGVGGGNDQVIAVEVGELERPLYPFEPSLRCQSADLRLRLWRNDAKAQSGFE